MTAKLAMMIFGIFHTEDGRTADRGGIFASHTKNPMARKNERMKGAMKPGDDQPSIGPSVKENTRQMRAPIIRMTPRISSRRQRGVLSGARGVLAIGIRASAIADYKLSGPFIG